MGYLLLEGFEIGVEVFEGRVGGCYDGLGSLLYVMGKVLVFGRGYLNFLGVEEVGEGSSWLFGVGLGLGVGRV